MAKLTTKQEKFCLALVKGMSLSDAYRKAYNVRSMKPITVNNEAHKLSQNPDIAARVEELKKDIAKAAVLTREWVVQKLIDNAKDAVENGDRSVANRAYELLGKELGMFVERVEQNTKHEFLVSDKPMSPDEFDQAFSVEPATRPTSSTH